MTTECIPPKNEDSAVISVAEKMTIVLPGGVELAMVSIPGKAFLMGKFLVTQAQWEAVTGENPSEFNGAENPVERISWDDCQTFLEKLNALPVAKGAGLVFRMPTAEEWEFACRAGATGDYSKLADGREITKKTLGEVAWFNANSRNRTHPVGQKKPNAFGLYDMHGNVWERTSTEFCGNRVDLGGAWDSSPWICVSDGRNWASPFARYNDLGLRLCASCRAPHEVL